MSKTSITIPDIAAAAGVSKSTVSLALQDSPKIKPETKRKVLKAAKQLGYVYNRAAANLRRRSSEIIGMVINDLTNPFFAELAVALERSFTDSGYVVMMANTSEDMQQQAKVVRTFAEHGAAGIVICPVFGTTYEQLTTHTMKGLPIVSVMRPIEGNECDFISPDNIAGSQAITQHLLEQGFTQLAFLGGITDTSVYQNRLAGFKAALTKANIPVDQCEILPCPPTREASAQLIMARAKQGPLPEAIVCYSDIVAFGVTFGLDRAGLKAGKDVAVTGFDDIQGCNVFSPSLTSVHIYTDQLAKLAAECLINRLKDPERPISNQTVMPKVIVRESSTLAREP
ncbi:LacI family DNA-binding transcriptional regulator [Spartinivicinus ruber]|uniref:LacI family DNA-binding transcriptional regulator n=1 Tax=Spartinivicinus ruber TaxID=2683272 RepID=UPI0013D0E1A2|nr:LacI family DNA-binding transcriptional regulator [Spartinivicinus ruber]